MDSNRINKLKWRWSLITAGVIALFWTIWYLINGEVPEVREITLLSVGMIDNNQPLVFTLQSGISRWWDVLFAPVWVVVLIEIFTSKKIQNNGGLFLFLILCLVLSLILGCIVGLSTVVGSELGSGLIFILFASLAFSLGADLLIGQVLVLGFSLGVGLFFGLGLSMIISLGLSVIIIMVDGLVFGLKRIKIKPIFSCISDWLMAKN